MSNDFETRGKNKEMLSQLKCDLKESLELYCSKKKIHPRRKEEIRSQIGSLFIRLSELATIRYRFNQDNNFYGISVDLIRDEITKSLWEIVEPPDKIYKSGRVKKRGRKFSINSLVKNNSTYNFFMKCANNFVRYYIRDILKKRRGYANVSYEALTEGNRDADISLKQLGS